MTPERRDRRKAWKQATKILLERKAYLPELAAFYLLCMDDENYRVTKAKLMSTYISLTRLGMCPG